MPRTTSAGFVPSSTRPRPAAMGPAARPATSAATRRRPAVVGAACRLALAARTPSRA
jgi:hypothetical protein